jgi:GWxTD domain-containing protein
VSNPGAGVFGKGMAVRALTLVLGLLSLVAVSPAPARASSDDAAHARLLFADAQRRLAIGSMEQRRIAAEDLERATLLDPANAAYPLELGWVCLEGDKLREARRWADAALRRDPANAGAQHLIGATWRRDWLVSADAEALDRAVVALARAVRRDPKNADALLLLVPLLVEEGESAAARDAAVAALRAAPGRPDALIAAAYTSQRLGDIELAEGLFERAIPRLAPEQRERFRDLAPLLFPAEAEPYRQMPRAERERYEQRFWAETDPDLVSPVNEAQLEFWARAAHASLLYYNRGLRTWDQRGDLYVRYGAPDFMVRNPLDMRRAVEEEWGNWMVWSYPALGMNVWMLATNPLGAYGGPKAGRTFGPFPFRDSLARHPEWAVLANGWTVIPKLPPGREPLAVEGMTARFADAGGPRLLAHAESPAGPADPRFAEYVVIDDAGHEVARGERPMSASACEPIEARAAAFTSELAPGTYRVGLAVHDGGRRRGVYRTTVEIPAASSGPVLSDVVVTCGAASALVLGQTSGHVEPDPHARVEAGDPLTVYFEIYGLTPGTGGSSRFEYVCTVSSLERDKRGWITRMLAGSQTPDPVEARREETTRGPVRRQFFSVPIESLPPGRYQVEVRVRDLVTGAETRGQTAFVHGR